MAIRPNTYTNDGGGKTVNGIDVNNVKTGDPYRDKLRQATVNASQRSANDRGGMNGMFNPGTSYGKVDIGDGKQADIVNKPGTTGNSQQRIEAWREANTPYTPPSDPTPQTQSEVTVPETLPSNIGGSNTDPNRDHWYNQVDELIGKLKGYLTDYETNSKTAFGAQRDEEYAQNKNNWRNSGDQINLNKARAERYMNALNGPLANGTGYRNNTAINLQWAKDHNANNRNLDTLNATTLNKYNTNLANLSSQLAQANANMVLPVYTNRIAQLDQLQQQRELNQMDYDYRRFLASMGMM